MSWNKVLQSNPAPLSGGKLEPTVANYLTVLRAHIVQYDQQQSRKRGYNQYALAQHLEAVQRIIAEGGSGGELFGGLRHLVAGIRHHFTAGFPPAEKTITAINRYLRDPVRKNWPTYPVPRRRR